MPNGTNRYIINLLRYIDKLDFIYIAYCIPGIILKTNVLSRILRERIARSIRSITLGVSALHSAYFDNK